MEKRPDRRRIRTRKLLRDALIELILKKGYDAVTVQDITDRANLGRATFYLHYQQGKEQLLMESLRDMFDDLKTRFGTPSRESLLTGELAQRVIPFQHAHEYRDLYRVTLLSEQGTAAIVKGIRQYLADSMRQRLNVAFPGIEPMVPTDVLCNYLSGAMIAMISWWLESNSQYSPEEMAEMFRQLSLPTIRTMMLID